jgi:nucleoid-associated protein YgaU
MNPVIQRQHDSLRANLERNRTMRYVICVAAAIPLLAACGERKPAEPAAPPPAMVAPDTAAPMPSPPPAPMAAPESVSPPVASPAESAGASPAAGAATTADTYVVVAGDTLFRIATKHGVKPKDLARWNGIKDPRRLRVGQKLKLVPH